MGGFDLTRNPFDEEQHRDKVVLAVDIADRNKGTFSVVIQDIPDGKLKSLRFALASAYATQGELMGVRDEVAKVWESNPDQVSSYLDRALQQGKATIASAEAQAEALTLLTLAQRDIVQWGVCDHEPEDFRFPKKAGEEPSGTPFQPVELPHSGEKIIGANHRMLVMYTKMGILERLCLAVLNYQDGKLLQAEAEWKRAEALREQAKAEAKKKKEESQKPSSSTPSTPESSPAPNESQSPSA
jgi:hypothetical protein